MFQKIIDALQYLIDECEGMRGKQVTYTNLTQVLERTLERLRVDADIEQLSNE